MQTEGIGFRLGNDVEPHDALDTKKSTVGEFHDDLQAVERYLPDFDWFEQVDDRHDRRCFRSETGAGRSLEFTSD